jgi:hypothetical protein
MSSCIATSNAGPGKTDAHDVVIVMAEYPFLLLAGTGPLNRTRSVRHVTSRRRRITAVTPLSAIR